MTLIQTAKQLLRAHSLEPKKYLGQSFLVDEGAIRKIIQAANLQKTDVALEIGPGLGALTFELAHSAKEVIAVERDPQMLGILKSRFEAVPNLELILADILSPNTRYPSTPFDKTQGKSLRASKIQDAKYKVVANLPYAITGPVIRKFLEATPQPQLMVLMVQKEVAQRICAKPPRMNLLAVSVQFYAKPEIVAYISKRSFWPQPRVDSAIIKIAPTPAQHPTINNQLFFRVVKAGFRQPRKQLVNNLGTTLGISRVAVTTWLLQNNIQPTQRAETLTLQNWKDLSKTAS